MKVHRIYVIGREEGPVKVGITSSLGGRLGQIQTGCPFKCEILHSRICRDRDDALWHEQNFHQVYDERRLSGEWFNIDADLAIEGVETGFELQEHFEQEAMREYQAAELNIWQPGTRDGFNTQKLG